MTLELCERDALHEHLVEAYCASTGQQRDRLWSLLGELEAADHVPAAVLNRVEAGDMGHSVPPDTLFG